MSFDLPEEPHHAKTVGRTLPHSREAEEYLLSSILLDPADVLPRCRDAKIRPDDFYDTKHGIIYDCVLDLFAREKPVDIAVVAEELKLTRQFEQVGGYPFLTQISEQIPTTAQAGYFVEKVKEQAVLRGIIRSATGAVEDCYSFSGGIEDFSSKVRAQIEHVTAGATGATHLLSDRKFDPGAEIVKARVVWSLGGVPLSTAGNLTQITAQSGVGKSAVVGAMIAAAMTAPEYQQDTLAFVGPNLEKLPLLHFDTEQSKGDFQMLLHRSLRRAGVANFPAWLHSYHLTGLSAAECRQAIEVAISQHARKAGGIFAIIIDGWADLVEDPNDGKECFPFVARMHALAIKHDCPIVGVLHLNPGKDSAKSRGHLGSQLERKAETVLQLEMNEDLVTAMYSTKKRGAPIRKDDGPRFSWNDDRGMHTLLADWREQAVQRREEKRSQKKGNQTAFAEKYSREEQVSFYPPSKAKAEARAVIFRKAQEGSQVSTATLERMRLGFLKDGWIAAEGAGQYRRTREGDDYAARRPGAVVPFRDEEQQEVHF